MPFPAALDLLEALPATPPLPPSLLWLPVALSFPIQPDSCSHGHPVRNSAGSSRVLLLPVSSAPYPCSLPNPGAADSEEKSHHRKGLVPLGRLRPGQSQLGPQLV